MSRFMPSAVILRAALLILGLLVILPLQLQDATERAGAVMQACGPECHVMSAAPEDAAKSKTQRHAVLSVPSSSHTTDDFSVPLPSVVLPPAVERGRAALPPVPAPVGQAASFRLERPPKAA